MATDDELLCNDVSAILQDYDNVLYMSFHAVSGKYQLLSWTKYIKYFYELYSPLYEIRQQLVDEFCSIPWGHHVQILCSKFLLSPL